MIRNLLNRFRAWRHERTALRVLGLKRRDVFMVTVPAEPVPGEVGRYIVDTIFNDAGRYLMRWQSTTGRRVSPEVTVRREMPKMPYKITFRYTDKSKTIIKSAVLDLPRGAVITHAAMQDRWTGREWPVDVVSQEEADVE